MDAPQLPSPGSREIKSSGLAIVMSFFWVGLGQLYAGEITRGIIMMVAWLFCIPVGLFGLFLTLSSGIGALSAISMGEVGSGLLMLVFMFVTVCLVLAPAAFWIWGMIDAKKLCERWNAQP